jgi:hypothetical protein
MSARPGVHTHGLGKHSFGAFTLGASAHAVLGQIPANVVARALAWTVAILAIAPPVAIAKSHWS